MGLVKGKVDILLVMGKSGAGKQPRIDVLTAEFGLEQLSTGNIFRDYLGKFDAIGFDGDIRSFFDETAGTFLPDAEIRARLGGRIEGRDPADVVLGLKAKYYIESGKFVPDAITNDLFRAAFARPGRRGTVLDGYPRTREQAEFLLAVAMEHGARINAVLLVEGDDEAIVARTIGRRICPKCKKVFHLEFKPPRDGKYCTACPDVAVILRSDDSEEKIRSRLAEFRTKALPALEYLRGKGISVAAVPGNLPVFTDAAVRESVMGAIETIR
jgi:adenylate kinase family enzyme